jgi:hypothetical protein
LIRHAALAVLIGLVQLALHLDGGIHKGFEVSKRDVDQHSLHLIVQSPIVPS